MLWRGEAPVLLTGLAADAWAMLEQPVLIEDLRTSLLRQKMTAVHGLHEAIDAALELLRPYTREIAVEAGRLPDRHAAAAMTSTVLLGEASPEHLMRLTGIPANDARIPLASMQWAVGVAPRGSPPVVDWRGIGRSERHRVIGGLVAAVDAGVATADAAALAQLWDADQRWQYQSLKCERSLQQLAIHLDDLGVDYRVLEGARDLTP